MSQTPPEPEPQREPMDTSPVYLWAAIILGLVIAGLVLARLTGKL